MRRRTSAGPTRVVAALAPLFFAATARADTEAWAWFETRVPIAEPGAVAPTSLRVFSDARFGTRYPGLGFLFLRVGPIWEVHEHLLLAVHLTAVPQQSSPDVFTQEYRFELEPNVRWSLGDFAFNDRQRFELRWIDGAVRWRLRNQLRVAFSPKDARWVPFVWDEVLVDVSGRGQHQNRAEAGVGYWFTKSTRLDVGFMLRSRATPTGWVNDEILNVALFFAPPRE